MRLRVAGVTTSNERKSTVGPCRGRDRLRELTKSPTEVVVIEVKMESVMTCAVRDRGPVRRYGLAVLEAAVALSAIAGGLALAVGSIDMGQEIDQRLPLDSPVIGGLALIAVVGLPMMAAALACVRVSSRAQSFAIAAGAALVIWILVEIAVIRSFSFLQPTFLTVGVVIMLASVRR